MDVAQDDVTVSMEDCGTILGLEMTALKEGEDIIEPLMDRIVGNVALEDIYDPIAIATTERWRALLGAPTGRSTQA